MGILPCPNPPFLPSEKKRRKKKIFSIYANVPKYSNVGHFFVPLKTKAIERSESNKIKKEWLLL